MIVRIMATKIKFTTSPKDEMTTKVWSKYLSALKPLITLKIKESIEDRKWKCTKTVRIMNDIKIAMN